MAQKNTKKRTIATRKISYDPTRHPSIIFALAVVGKLDGEIARLLDIGKGVFARWQSAYPEVHKALEDAKKEGAVLEVESAMFKRALGFTASTQSVRSKIVKGAEGQPDKLIPVGATKAEINMAPDVKAGVFILTNRQPKKWKQKVEVEVKPSLMGEYLNVHYYLPENGRPLLPEQTETKEKDA